MGRNKIAIERLPTEDKRKATYQKRRAGVVKKAHEIATLCDVDVVLIMFSCTGRLDHFCSQPGIWKILQRFIQEVQSISEIEPEDLPISQDCINSINNLAEHHEVANRSGLDAPDREEIKRENVDEIDCTLLQLQKIMMHSGRKAFNSEQEFRELVQGLHRVRLMIADGMEHSGKSSYNTSHSTQILMQQPQTRIEAGTQDPPGGGADMQQQRFPILGEDPSSFLSVPWKVLMQYLQASPPGHGTCEGREHIQQQEVPAGFPMEDLFVSPEHIFGAQQDVGIFFSEQIESEPGTGLSEAPDDAPQRFEDTTNRNGKRDRSN